jgi:beta-lactamase regulating signal transducer with metallopeptidase domain
MLAFVVDLSVRITVAAALVGAVLWALRVRSAAARHAAWTAVLLTMVAMPILAAIVPRIPVPVPFHLPTNPGAVAVQLDEVLLPPSPRFDDSAPAMVSAAPAPNVEPREPSQLPAVSATTSVDWLPFAVALYLVGVATLSARLVVGWRMARPLVRSAARLNLTAAAPVFESAAVAAPLTTGICRPSIVLPGDWRRWPADTVRAVLAHENAHVIRRDLAVQFLARVNRALFWFHPVAWWLERQLAITSEQACDDAVVRSGGEPRRYAEILLRIAEAVTHRGQRIAWTAVGMDGSGLLGARIDRVLRGDVAHRMSVLRRASVAAGCAVVLVIAVACRQQISAEPLRPDPEVQKQIDANQARAERHKAAVAMTVEEAAALERSLETNPDDVETREKLIIFYDQAGKVSWEEKLAGMRRHGLWRLENLPHTDLWIPNISKRYDPEGYAQATRLWTAQTSKPDATAQTLGRAATFFGRYDKPIAEELLLRAWRLEPDGPWAARLGDLYAGAIVGSVDSAYGTIDPDEAKSPFAAEARRKLEATDDASVLAAAGRALTMRYSRQAATVGADVLGRQALERAAALDPQNPRAQRALADLRHTERSRAIQARLAKGTAAGGDQFSDARYEAISALPDEDRLFYLPGAAESAYMSAEYIEYTAREKARSQEASAAQQRAAAGFARARQFAAEALALAERHPQAARDYHVAYRAHTVLGVLALKDGDLDAAVEHMQTASAAPISETARYASHFGLRGRLVTYLIRAGERESVAQYLESSADRFLPERGRLLDDARAIREGRMPSAYQHMLARESAPGTAPDPAQERK